MDAGGISVLGDPHHAPNGHVNVERRACIAKSCPHLNIRQAKSHTIRTDVGSPYSLSDGH